MPRASECHNTAVGGDGEPPEPLRAGRRAGGYERAGDGVSRASEERETNGGALREYQVGNRQDDFLFETERALSEFRPKIV